MRTLVPGERLRIWRVASIPLRPGMTMSMSTTSGMSSSAFSTASRPLEASPTTSRPSCASSIMRRAWRRSAWSSATRMRTRWLVRIGRARVTGAASRLRSIEVIRPPCAVERYVLNRVISTSYQQVRLNALRSLAAGVVGAGLSQFAVIVETVGPLGVRGVFLVSAATLASGRDLAVHGVAE